MNPSHFLHASQENEQIVFNLSKKSLTTEQETVLRKGLSFVPSPRINPFSVKIELFKFLRNIKLKSFFNQSASENPHQRPRFRPKSTFTPQVQNSSVNTFCRIVEHDIDTLLGDKKTFEKNMTKNLTASQREALITLKEDQSIVIQKSDKGGGIVLQDTSTYIQKIKDMLSDATCYKKLPLNPVQSYKDALNRKIHQGQDMKHLNEREAKFLANEHPVTPVLYALPKIHKSETDPPYRPIVSGINSLTEKVSEFVDYHIQPLVKTLPSFIRDTTELLNKLRSIQIVDENDWLVTLDVSSLYTSIPHKDGLEALNHFLNQTSLDIPADLILDFTEFILTHNYFLFEKDYYLQLQGTAMGTPLAPSYANLFMGKFEEDFVYNNPFISSVKVWFRYIDDCFMIWGGSESELLNFITFLNSRAPTITFSSERDLKSIHFLDVLISKQNNEISTTVFRKSTDKNTLLSADSHHPVPLKRGLPLSQLYRIRRICDTDAEFENQSTALLNRFRARGYPDQWLSTAYEKVRCSERSELLMKSKKQSRPFSVNYALTYNGLSRQIKHIVDAHWHILATDPSLKNTFSTRPLFTYKRSNNLSNLLVRSDVVREDKRASFIKGCFPCRNCAACPHILKTNSFTNHQTGKVYKIDSLITCTSTKVIYLLQCPCQMSYVGKTIRSLKTRLSEHKSAIRRGDITSPVARHFMEKNHTVQELKCIGIEQVHTPRRGGNLDKMLLQREAFWMYHLQSMSPKGMNEDFELTCFL